MKYHSDSRIISMGCIGLLIISLTFALLANSQTGNAEVYVFENSWGEEGFNLTNQSSSQVEIVYSLHKMEILDFQLAGETLQNVAISGVVLPHDPGSPNLPIISRYIAVPQGAQAQIEILDFRAEIFSNISLAPAFEIPIDTDLSPLRYQKNPSIYAANSNFPAQPFILSPPLRIRGVDAVIVSLTPFQYNPFTKDLVVYKDVRLRITFIGGNGHFGEDRLRSRWWDPVLKSHLMNWESLPPMDYHHLRLVQDDTNVEYIIITPNDPVFIAWADTLKRWRNEQGILTGVATLSQIGGNDTTLIENYINNAYNTWEIPPVAVLLLSDYQIGAVDQYGITSANFCEYLTDNKYADVDGDYLPDLNLARICAQNNQQLQTIITKMLNYERYPVTNPNFYNHPILAGGYQADTWFIFCTEVLYGFMHNNLNRNPVRGYGLCAGPPGPNWSSNVNTYMVLNYFGPSGLNYVPASPSYLSNWGGNANSINRDVNNGAFLMQYRDHGGYWGWNMPSYTVGDVANLMNSTHPFIFSIGCSTGRFNYPTPCFAEAMHRSQYGALGLIAASAPTYSFINDTYTWGIYDFMWPDFDPGYGAPPDLDPNLQTGFANVSGKYYLHASSWPSNPTCKWFAHQYFHHHGDAFMTLYSQLPQTLTVTHDSTIAPGATLFAVSATAGSWIALSVNGNMIASTQATGSPQLIQIPPLTPGQTLKVTVTRTNYYRYSASVPMRAMGLSGISISTVPLSDPIQIPATGGSFSFYTILTNSGSSPQVASTWSEVLMYNGQVFGPLNYLGNLTLAPGSSSSLRTQYVPGFAPSGPYTYRTFVGSFSDIIWDYNSFPFLKLAFDSIDGGNPQHSLGLPSLAFALISVNPNPFNHLALVRYQMPEAGQVSFNVWDTTGRLVAKPLDGWNGAGEHEFTFDGTRLPSGVYLYTLKAGNQSASGKFVLLK